MHIGLDELAHRWAAELDNKQEFTALSWIQAVLVTFLTTPEAQLGFIEKLLERTVTEEALADIGAGPLEGFLARYPDRVSDIERIAPTSPRLRQALCFCWQQAIDEHAWRRVQKSRGMVGRDHSELSHSAHELRISAERSAREWLQDYKRRKQASLDVEPLRISV